MQASLESTFGAIVRQFRMRYWILAIFFTVLVSLLVAWIWSWPLPDSDGLAIRLTLPVLLFSGLLVNLISFFFQDRYVRRTLRASDVVARLASPSFTWRFYLISLLTGIVLGAVLYYPFLLLFFFYALYPIVAWLIPYQLIMAFMLRRDLRADLAPAA